MSLETFRLIAPEFAGESDATVNSMLTMAALYVNLDLYPVASQDLAQSLKAASLMLSRKNSANGQSSGGELLSEKEGDLQRSYGAATGQNEGMDIYAQQLRDLELASGLNRYSASVTRMADQVPGL